MLRANARHITSLTTAILALVLLAAAAPAAAQGAPAVHLRVEAHDGDGFWFETNVTGDERNPTIQLPAGATVHVTFVNAGDASHTLDFGDPIGESTGYVGSGDEATLEFTVPEDASGTGEYWCQPHRGAGMAGVVEFTAAGDGADSPAGGGSPDGGDDGDGGGGGDADAGANTPGFGPLAAVAAAITALFAAGRRR